VPRPRRHPLRPAVQVAVMKYKGREIVAPEKFLPEMEALLKWYEGKGDKIAHCPLCSIAQNFDNCCETCPWNVCEGHNCDNTKFGGLFKVCDLRTNPTPKWADYRIRQLRRWIAIYEKAAAEVPS